jgi:hypothetical protein
MRGRLGLVLLLAALPAGAAPPAQANAGIDPRASRELRRMSDYLTNLRSFRVNADTVDEVVTKNGLKLQQVADSQLSVKRPNMLRSERVGPVADVTFRYDGRTLSLYGKRTGYYAIAPAAPTLDRAVDQVRDQYGLDAPAGDLLVSHPYNALMEDVTSGQYVGLEPIDGIVAHHLAFQGKNVDWQIWIQDGPQPLPLRYVITSKHETGQPEFTVRLSGWEPNAPLPDSLFVFRPPPGSKRIQLLSRANRASY